MADQDLERRLEFLEKSNESLHANLQQLFDQVQADRTLTETRFDKLLNILDRVSDMMQYHEKLIEKLKEPPKDK